MKNSSDRNQLKLIDMGIHIACMAVVLISLIAGYRFGYDQLKAREVSLDAQRLELLALMNSEDEVASAHRLAQEELSIQQQKLVDLLKRMPEQPKEVDFLAQITGLARKSGVKIQDYQPQQISSGEEYRELQIKLNAHGGYTGICYFLDEMHSLQRLNRVSQLFVEPIGATSKKQLEEEVPQYKASLQLHIYFMPVRKTERIASLPEGQHG
ncbi:Pilus assembly protein, PilO [Polystyrenella longa]|uniref:Pilus assembly protein, PilO n=1 Tax=Polystyrenella longa TaxID=2528007 RepID=A0A518CRM7_9PLAN|nr:type 4a pilus biogenesis protein PilO [Polystyrenella longa]QDU81886.1 Pilus assembly protein, PilO [Polystyrenella longa]